MNFNDLQINQQLKKNLQKMNLQKLTPIQQETFHDIIKGNDIIGVSKTGSGKSLAFILPLIQRMVDDEWNHQDGLYAVFVTPTRELSVQLVEILRRVTKGLRKDKNNKESKGNKNKKDIEICLSIGGKEDKITDNCEILVGTPGRILQNLGSGLSADNIQFLVVDEADKLVEMGFKEVMKNIIDYLNPERQTLLFSATKIEDVEIFNLKKNKKIVSTYSNFSNFKIKNFYFLCQSDEKIKILYNLIDSEKTIIFFSTCKTAKFYYLLFSRLFRNKKYKNINNKKNDKDEYINENDNPKNIYLLSSNLSQNQRISIYTQFLNGNGTLFCTDVGARGLDFKEVKKIIQFDCPESPETFIHRAGRSGRNEESGINYLFLLNSEKKFVDDLFKIKEKIPFEISFCENQLKNKFEFNKISVRIKSVIYRDRELRDFFEKYIRTYSKFLGLYKKKYNTDVEKEIKSLRELFGFL
ncbi:ATP-dependent RNA helicase DBP4 [Dictyocoela muelleri]|nr:ATP-dependent RNA helicase DBP4 [Dictyocoela muelleri]